MSGEMAMPGDELATSEEYMPGQGTYERDGSIYAAVMGRIVVSEKEMTVRVLEVRRPIALRPGDTVLGEVTNVSNSIANVAVSCLLGPGERHANEVGAIHVSKVADSYTDDARKEFHTSDMVRARVLQAFPSLQLSTRDADLGVLKALCARCRRTLFNRSGKLYCPDCEKSEHRKLASDFGMYTPEFRESTERPA